MRLIFTSSFLHLILSVSLLCGAQTQAKSSENTQRANAGKQVPAKSAPTHAAAKHKGTRHRAARTRYRRSHRKRTRRAAYRPEFTQNSVEVINGSSTQKVVFNDQNKPQEQARNGQMKVEVVNGNATDTRYFAVDKNGTPTQGNTVKPKQPVVVGIQSSDTKVAGGNKHPVVTAITEVGPTDTKTADTGGQKVTTDVAPQPKRPDYQPQMR